MLSTSRGFIYIHVPKTGGNSVQTALLKFSDDVLVTTGHQDGLDRFDVRGPATPHEHARLADYQAKLGNRLQRFRVVISVRHPFDRALSFFFSPHRWAQRCKDGTWMIADAVWSEEAFVVVAAQIPGMVDYLRVNGCVVRPHYILRYETLAVDFSVAVRELGMEGELISLPHVNRSLAARGEIARARTSIHARHIVEERFRDDYDYFGYRR